MTPDQFRFEYIRLRRWYEFFDHLCKTLDGQSGRNNKRVARIRHLRERLYWDLAKISLTKDEDGDHMYGKIFGSQIKTLAELRGQPPAPENTDAYLAGFDRGAHGPDEHNCHPYWFSNDELKQDWFRGKTDGLRTKSAQ